MSILALTLTWLKLHNLLNIWNMKAVYSLLENTQIGISNHHNTNFEAYFIIKKVVQILSTELKVLDNFG